MRERRDQPGLSRTSPRISRGCRNPINGCCERLLNIALSRSKHGKLLVGTRALCRHNSEPCHLGLTAQRPGVLRHLQKNMIKTRCKGCSATFDVQELCPTTISLRSPEILGRDRPGGP